MNCVQSHDLLQRRLDGEAIPNRAALDQHLNNCPECRHLHAAAGSFEEGLRLLTIPVAPKGLTAAIVGQVMADRRARQRRRRWVAVAALAAGVLVAVFVARESLSTTQSVRVIAGKAVERPAVAEGPPSLAGSLFDVGEAVAGLTRRTATETVGQTRLLIPDAPPLTGPDSVGPMLDPPAQSLKQAGQGVAVALDPVTSSAKRAFSMFIREPSGTEKQ
ncbi:MAG: zf-HC2 domain-containing protein [Gemmataceae bacterium]|nr:zf-HC2 domain-containing protein [Gemmataceae bacterium]